MSSPKLYIAGMGMITPLGPNVSTTVAAVNAGISAYSLSEYQTEAGEPITMARVPNQVFERVQCEFPEEGDVFNYRHERMIRMAIIALREGVLESSTEEAVPLLLAMPEMHVSEEDLTPIVPALVHNLAPWSQRSLIRRFSVGRSAGMEAINFAFDYLMNQPQDYVLIVGVDSFDDDTVIGQYKDRLLSLGGADTFAPGEGASALLLTRHLELADKRDGVAIALHKPGMADEEGHLFSDKPYRGDGLDKAFKLALKDQPAHSIHTIYSSMNGENYWAKEYGVAYLRSKEKFIEDVKIEHPADCFGDLGAATATALITVAAEKLRKTKHAQKTLVSCSSDKATRGALVIEKILAQ